MPQLSFHIHLDHDVAWIEQTFARDLLPVTQLHHFFFRNQNLSDFIGEPERLGPRAERFRNLALEAERYG